MSEPVHLGEFNRAIDMLSRQVIAGNNTTSEVLVEAKKTNGRVYALERTTSEMALRLSAVENNVPVTRRDLWVAVGTLATAGALVKWLPALFSIGSNAP